MEEGGTYVATNVMVGRGKWYLQCFRCDVVLFVGFFFIGVEMLDVLCVWVEV